jgi:GNAT superfamily N-acetyltransferase
MNAPDYEGNHMDEDTITRRFRVGDACIVADVDGDVAALSWIRFDNASFRRSWLSIPLESGEAYFAWTRTDPKHRGKGLATRLARWRWRWLRERGVHVAYSWIRPANDPMLCVTSRAGAMAVSWLTQYYPRVIQRPRLNFVCAALGPARLSNWCSPSRMRFPQGLTFFTHNVLSALQPSVERREILASARTS